MVTVIKKLADFIVENRTCSSWTIKSDDFIDRQNRPTLSIFSSLRVADKLTRETGRGYTWKTVSSDCQNESKLLRGLSTSGLKLNLPPNSCMPSRAKMTMKRKSSSSRLTIDLILLSSDATRLRRDAQYLNTPAYSSYTDLYRTRSSDTPPVLLLYLELYSSFNDSK